MTSARQAVTVELGRDGAAHPQRRTACWRDWPYGELEHAVGARRCAAPRAAPAIRRWRGWKSAIPRSPLRSTSSPSRSTAPARTERRARRPGDRSGALAATVSLVLVAVFGVPALADRLAPLIPLRSSTGWARRSTRRCAPCSTPAARRRPFECGTADAEQRGRAALDKLIGRLEAAAACRSRSSRGGPRAARPTPLHCPADTSTSSRG